MNPELVKLLAELMAGLSVPGSLRVLGEAQEPWMQLRDRWRLFGYQKADEIAKQIEARESTPEFFLPEGWFGTSGA